MELQEESRQCQAIQWAELGGDSAYDGTEVYSGKRKDGISEIYERKLRFVSNVTYVTS